MERSDIRVLIVDDEEGILEALQTHLMLDGYQVDTASSGAKALELFKMEPYQIVLSDINMPEMDGLELLEKIRGIRGDTYVIMITAYTTLSKVLTSRFHGAFDYVLKPFADLEEVDKAVHRAEALIYRWYLVLRETRQVKAAAR
jgi:DNA-binding NtrC family response regulator